MKKPSVTELTKLLDKPALLYWANKIGLQGVSINDYRKESTNYGINLHKQIEDYLVLGKSLIDTQHNKNCIDFFNDKEIISIEEKLENEYFTGRLDVKFIFNGYIYIADFKSNQSNIYLENKLQLSSYKMISGCDKVCIISIPDFKIIPIDDINYNSCEEIMIMLSKIYKLKETI